MPEYNNHWDVISMTFTSIRALVTAMAEVCSVERFDRIMRQGLEIKIEKGEDGNPQIDVKIIRPGLL